jgi:plastocyanin
MTNSIPRKISQLNSLSELADSDIIPVVDSSATTSSASGETKRVSFSVLKSGVLAGLNTSNWDSAYGWGDHSSAGYLTNSFAETDPVFTASAAFNVTTSKISDWDSAYSWGDHAQAGYLTGANETDPVFTASAAGSIVSQDLANWNSAYGWGNHASAGYITSVAETDPVFTASAAAGVTAALISNWNTAYGWGDHSGAGYLANLSSSSVNDLSDIFVSGPTTNQILQYNGTNWVNVDSDALTSYTEVDTLASVTARGASTSTACTFQNLTVSGDLNVVGTTTQSNVATLNVTNNEIVINENQASGALNAVIRNDRGTDADVSIIWNEVNDTWQFTNDGSNYQNIPTKTSELTNDANFLTSVGSISNSTDVTVTSPSSEQILVYNGSNWVNEDKTNDAQITIQNTAPAGAEAGDLWWKQNDATLKIYYNSAWVDASPTGGDPFEDVYGSVSLFPGANVNEGRFAYSEATNAMYYSNATSWTSQRLVTTNNSTTSDFATLLANTQLTYSIGANNYTTGNAAYNAARKTIVLGDSLGNTTEVILTAGSGLSVIKSNNEITFTNDVADSTYSISAEEATGASNSALRLTDNANNNDEIIFAGADGLTIERTDANTLTFRAPSGSSGNFNAEDAQDAAAQLFANGTHTGISFTYNDTNNTINAQATGGGSTTPSTFSFTTSAEVGNYLVTGSDRSNTFTGDADPTITVYAGDTITFDNTSTYSAHPMYIRVSDQGASVSSPAPTGEGTATVSWTPTTAGTYYYQCSVHPAMLGTITVLSVGSGGGGGTTYDLIGTNTTSNNAIIRLRDASNNDDDIEIAGGGGTSVSWDNANSRVTISSTTPVQSDWNASSGLEQILNKPNIPPEYTLPAAAAGTLGGVKIGANLSIDGNGILSANAGAYTLPAAAAGTLGGVKIGSGLSIDGNGILTATGGSSVPQIQDLSGTTASIANDTSAELNITGYKAYSLFKITTDAEAWVKVYVDDASRDADTTRSEGEDPAPGSGVISEVRTTGAESILISPGIMGFNNDNPRTNTIYLTVTNRSGSATTVTVTLTALQIGE